MKILAIIGISAAYFQQTSSPLTDRIESRNLITESRIEGLSEEVKIILATTYALHLDPGVTAKKSNESFVLSTYDGAKIRVGAGAERITVTSPIVAHLGPSGWDLGMGKTYAAPSLDVSRDAQDDTDSNLKSMQESARKLKSKSNADQNEKQPGRKLRVRWLFGENPMPTAELFNTPAIQQLTHLSQIGF